MNIYVNYFPSHSLTELNNMEYQTVKVSGYFLHDKELYLGPRTLIEPAENSKKGGVLTIAPKSGYLVITPFKLNNREYDDNIHQDSNVVF